MVVWVGFFDGSVTSFGTSLCVVNLWFFCFCFCFLVLGRCFEGMMGENGQSNHAIVVLEEHLFLGFSILMEWEIIDD